MDDELQYHILQNEKQEGRLISKMVLRNGWTLECIDIEYSRVDIIDGGNQCIFEHGSGIHSDGLLIQFRNITQILDESN